MSIDLSSDAAWIRDLPDIEVDVGSVLRPEFQAEHDRLLALHRARLPHLDPDLEELENAIANTEFRRLFNPELPPYMFDRYEAIATMRGGMGLVLEARDPQLDRLVAIKLWMRAGAEAQADLIAEAKTMAKLKHENVVTVYDLGVWNERVFFVMEWIEGVDGQDWMKRKRSWREVRRVFVAAGNGLAAAHDAAIHHRDFKPSNILIGRDGRVVVADFGLAVSLHTSPGREGSEGRAGTTLYMAPERIRGKRGDARSDQFSFCVAMWQALFHQPAFEGQTSGELSAAIERGELEEAPGVDVPRWLVEVVRQGLAYDPAARHRDMRSLIAALLDEPPAEPAIDARDVEDDVAVEDGRALHKGVGASPPRERWPYVATGFLAALVAVLGALVWMRSTPSPQPTVAKVQVDPYQAVLGLVATDEFVEAKQLWLARESEWSDEQALKVAETCLSRAKELAAADSAKASEAAMLAEEAAGAVAVAGRTPEARKAGGQLITDVVTWVADLPPTGAD